MPINGSTSNALLFVGPTNLLADNGPSTSLQFNTPTTTGSWSIGSTTGTGVIISGKGTTFDYQLQNSSGTAVMSVPTSSTNVILPALSTTATIANSICATSVGLLISNGGNCFASSGSPGGSNTQVQFNTNGMFGGISGVTSDSAGIGINTATITTLTGSTARFTTLSLTGNLTGTTAQFSGAVTGTTAQFQTYTGSTANFTGNLTGTTAQFSGAITGTTSQMQTRTGATLNLTSNLTGTTAQFSGALTGTTAQFQTMTVGSLTPTGPNCLQETGGVLQATNAACSAGGGTPGGTNTQVQFNASGAFGGDPGFTYTTPAAVTITSGIITTNVMALGIFQTWNTSAVSFDAPLFMNITSNTAGATSLLADFQMNGTSQFTFKPTTSANGPVITIQRGAPSFGGPLLTTNQGNGIGSNQSINGTEIYGNNSSSGNGPMNVQGDSNGNGGQIIFGKLVSMGWTNGNTSTQNVDTVLFRDGNGILGQHSTSTPQMYAVYNTVSNINIVNLGSNAAPPTYERAVVGWTVTSNTFSVGTQSNGNGPQGRNMEMIVSNTRQALLTTTSISAANALNIPAIAQLATNTTGYVCWTTGTGAITEDSTTCLASLRALKMNIAPFDRATSELVALKPSMFQWREPVGRNQQGPQLGFVAEDVVDVDPRLASYTGDGSLHGWRQDAMISLLVRGFQEQQKEITDLKAELARRR